MKILMHIFGLISDNSIVYFFTIIFDLFLIFSEAYFFRLARIICYIGLFLWLWQAGKANSTSSFRSALILLSMFVIGRVIKHIILVLIAHLKDTKSE